MGNDELVDKIVHEVLKQIAPFNADTPPKKETPPGKRVLVVLFGGAIGLKESLAELKKIIAAGFEVQVVCSPAAERVIGLERLKSELGNVPVFTEADRKAPGALIKSADVVTIPMMTINSAAKIANGIADTLAATVVMYGLLFGKPVVAVRDGCCPDNPARVKAGMNRENLAYHDLLAGNLKRLVEYGIAVVDAQDLSEAVAGSIQEKCGLNQVEEKKETVFTRRVLSAGDVALCKNPVIRVSEKTVITAMARDLAGDRGIKIVSE